MSAIGVQVISNNECWMFFKLLTSLISSFIPYRYRGSLGVDMTDGSENLSPVVKYFVRDSTPSSLPCK